MANMKTGEGVDQVIAFLQEKGGLKPGDATAPVEHLS
jgi:hypothetical protein